MLEGYFYPSSALLKKACISYQQMRSSGRKERASFLPPCLGRIADGAKKLISLWFSWRGLSETTGLPVAGAA